MARGSNQRSMMEMEMYDSANDVDDIFPEEFRKYVKKENLLCWKSRAAIIGSNLHVFKKANSPDDDRLTSDCLSLVDTLIGFLETQFMVQFWAAEEVVVNTTVDHTNYRLTTTNHPFLLGNFPFFTPVHEGLCRYRMKTCDVIVPGDGRGGAIGRVFQNIRLEYSPHVAYYSSEEYPLRDVALSCHITHSMVFPWFDSYGKVVGVIEFISTQTPYRFKEFLGYFNRYLSSSLGMGVDRCQGLCAQVRDGLFKKDLEKDLLSSVLSEINEVIGVVFESRNIIIFAQTWMLCNNCNSLYVCEYCPELDKHNYFPEAGTSCILQKGQGVVGKAAESSHSLVYCENAAKFSIAEYPLVHMVRLYNFSACFALSLRSSYTGDQIYILEFYLSPERVRGVDLRTMLVPILDLMKRKFRTFKVAYGREELGDKLPLLVTDANSPDKLENLKTTKLNLTLALGVNNVEGLELFKNEGPGESSRQSFVQRSIDESSKSKTDDSMNGLETSTEDTPMEDAPVVSASTVQSEFHVTIKANYGEDRFLKFPLKPFSGIDELYRQLSQRLELVDGTYNLKYLDEENDLIELLCDEDLQLYISNSIEHGIFTLTVLIVPK